MHNYHSCVRMPSHVSWPSPFQQGCKGHKLDSLPSTDVTLTQEDAWKYYKDAQTIRRMETTAGEMYRAKHIRGFCHLYSGQVRWWSIGVG